MKKIIIAGAGHGGLTAAYALAKAGCEVTVFEAKQRGEVGHDWCDCISKSIFGHCGIPAPPDSSFTPFLQMCYRSTSKTVKVVTPARDDNAVVNIDRRVLLNHLISLAEDGGASLIFGAEVTGAIYEDGAVRGINAVIDGSPRAFYADLVIDSAGCFSPVRSTLPPETGIISTIREERIFHVFRAFYNKLYEPQVDPPYNIYFYHCGLSGMDWMIDENGFADVLIGAFGPLTEAARDMALADFRSEYPFIGTEVLRGGSFAAIPLRPALPVFVCDGYAAVGDSACMTEPLSGSGINLSMRAGKLLADTVINAGENALTAEVLWNYEYQYMKRDGLRQLSPDVTQRMMLELSPAEMDTLFEKKVLTAKELGKKVPYTASDIVHKLTGILSRPGVIPALVRMAARTGGIKNIKTAMPEHYDRRAVEAWAEKYEKFIGE